jgi:GMP synthase-like glutamine amidotransferase
MSAIPAEKKSLKIAVLETDAPDEGGKLRTTYGTYVDMFRLWITRSFPWLSFEMDSFDVQKLKYPEDPTNYDLYMITGSRASAYDADEDWIRQLEHFIQKLDELKVKILGICFGHQIIAKALGGEVIKNPKGWEVSWAQFDLNEMGCHVFNSSTQNRKVNLFYSHQDIVSRLPPGAIGIGGNKLTEHQAMVKDHSIISFQGHPEFNKDIMELLLASKEAAIPAELHRKGVQLLDFPTSEVWLAQKSFRYLNLL